MPIYCWILLILAILALLLVAVASVWIGIHVSWENGKFSAKIILGPFSIQFPAEKDRKIKKRDGKKKPETAGPIEKRKLESREIFDFIKTVWDPLKKALSRMKRKILIKPLKAVIILGGSEDPAVAAQLYGELQAIIWTFMPELEQLILIKNPSIHIQIDFDAVKTVSNIELGISIRLGELLRIIMGLAVPALNWLLAEQKKHDHINPSVSKNTAEAER